jgi:hypothetical protein
MKNASIYIILIGLGLTTFIAGVFFTKEKIIDI